MVGWHHQFNGHEFEQTPGDGEGQRSLACCSPWGYKEMATTWQLNNTQVSLLPAQQKDPLKTALSDLLLKEETGDECCPHP